jgi:hypothetical protein
MMSFVRRLSQKAGMLAVLTILTISACQSQHVEAETTVTSHLTGTLTVSAEVDTVADYSGFSVIIGREGPDGLDTLGHAITTSDGRFSTAVRAPARGLYPLIIAREGSILHVDQLVVADADTATLLIELPVNRRVRVGGKENSAWLAYQNTRALHNQSLIEALQEGELETDGFTGQIMQASSILWGLQETFPGTLGADVAAGESVVMLDAWDDALLVERAREIRPDNPTYLEVVRAARRAVARIDGHEAALAALGEFRERANSREMQAAIQAERAIAQIDSLDEEGARQSLAELRSQYAGTEWAEWADEAQYEIDNLLPGRQAPALDVETIEGESITLADLRGRYVMIEFFVPRSEEYLRQLPVRNALIEGFGDRVETISLSLQPDEAINEAFLQDRDFPGHYVVLDNGVEDEHVTRYNVKVVPSRFLIDPEGRIIGRYLGEGLYALQSDLAERLEAADAR